MEIGKLIYDKRKEAGMTQEQLAGIDVYKRQVQGAAIMVQ